MSLKETIKLSLAKYFIPEQKVVLPSNDVAWSESTLYNGKDFPKYNPDDLIGKKGAGIYRKMMRDEQVKAVTRFKRDAITSRKFMFTVDKEALGEEEAAKRVALSEHIVADMKGSFVDSLNGIMTAAYQGFSMSEKVFKQVEFNKLTYWGIKAIKVKPYDTFKFNVDDYGNIERVVQEMDNKEQTIDIRKFIHYVHNPEYDEHYGQSELYEAYRAYFSKDMAIKFQNIWLEKHAQGHKVIEQDETSTLKSGTTDYNTLVAALSKGGSMILPKGVRLNVNFPANNVAFAEAIDMYDLHIARALLVPNLMGITPTGQTGSYSQSDTQLKAFLWTLNADTVRLEETINEQLFRQLGEINFNDDLWPRFKFKPLTVNELIELINTWKDLVSGGAVQHTDTDEAYVRELLDFPEAGELIEKPQPANPFLKPEDTAGEEEVNNKDKIKVEDDDVEEGETIKQGAALYSADVISRATKRVDFKVIERKSIDNEVKYIPVFSKLVAALGTDAINKLNEFGAVQDIKVKDVKFMASTKAKLKRAVHNMLKDGWRIGERAAANELDKAKGEFFSANNISKERMTFATEDYLTERSFFVAGKLSDDAQAMIDNVILQGIKYDKTFDEIKLSIFQAFADANLISIEDAEEALAEALVPNPEVDVSGIKNPTARIETMVRTNTFDAINESRYNFYTDPTLEGFVEGLEYSAILDGRTTSICESYNGHKAPVNDPIWNTIRPPNHFNCRSLLIPITMVDKWKKSKDLGIGDKAPAPADGFS